MKPQKSRKSLSEKRSLRELDRRRRNREAILHAAEIVIGRKGLTASSMDDVAAEAGFSKATLYKYIQGKSELVMELLIHYLEDLNDRLAAILIKPVKPEAKLLLLLREILRYQAEKANISRAFIMNPSHMQIFRAMAETGAMAASETEKDFFHRLQTARRAMTGHLERFLREGIASGDFRPFPLEIMVRFLTAVILGYQHDQLFRESKPDIDKDIKNIHEFILRGFKTESQADS
ncbi:MAG: helix-turn-helix domain containing protein [Acidobacteriota bacterium]|jgi:Transcriptional regulator|nr:TetR/AcrR family transcriptional regulator [Acidobacteriota bacterium]OQB57532.1 MAG: HTH-type transcriptional repressor KstR2 [Candidatus Aminicenantes bacterium ADurb.Bin147]HNQ80128.1 helix-turn-helix domain-containing protein [Candidatus Aminicenantes bacterium]MDD8009497.1 helix-turn-helix domain containing protein [Acidobacteriota bacterium]MDD8028637.1 helix-turn-helix domain containing protein [Acidobacteriota bacterium]